jgi:asparagine synthase (glutamine-hydrolysing)
MCGIAGILNHTSDNPVSIVSRMLSTISYRGPDESGIYSDPRLTFGNVRLSIIDIASGQQPLSDYNQRYWIVFNGEIFNYVELRNGLLRKGYKFKTKSDTEVLIQLYACYGVSALSKLNGQFAFAIWDKNKKELFLARDRVGIRPLFYHFRDNAFTFASEIKSLFQNPEIQRQISPESLQQVFTFWTTLTPNTVFKEIYEVPPGHYMKVDSKGLTVKKYWELSFDNHKKIKYASVNEAAEDFDHLFTDAVKIRLRADVEVAAYLSGGIDSSITTSYIKQVEPSILNTFSIGFQESEFDESSFQLAASTYLGTSHHSIQCNAKEIAERFASVVWHSEIPLLRTAPVPMHVLSRLVRDHNIKVVITGEGADEMLGGYNIFKENAIRNFWAKYPDSKIRPLLLKKLYPYLPQMKNASPMMLKLFFGYKLENTNHPFYSHLLRWNNTSHLKKHLHPELNSAINGYDPLSTLEERLPAGFLSWNSLEKAQWLESTIFMSGYLLSSQGDRMAMANSVEGRYPFLDHRIIEFCAQLASAYKLNGLTEKYLLKKLVKGKLPEAIINRSKQAYRAPVSSTFLDKNTPEYIRDILDETYIKKTGIFNAETVLPMIDKMKKSTRPTEIENMTLTGIISTHILHEKFIGKYHNSIPADLKNVKIYKNA